MLADPLHISVTGRSALILSAIAGGDPGAKRLQRGIYQISHFSFEHMLPEVLHFPDDVGKRSGYWLTYPNLGEPYDLGDRMPTFYDFEPFGVCDSPEQFLEHDIGKWIVASEKKYVVSFTKITKAEQPKEGGWRWHKWGPYIGKREPECEYIHDEGDEIQEVYCYHVYECLSDDAIAPIEES